MVLFACEVLAHAGHKGVPARCMLGWADLQHQQLTALLQDLLACNVANGLYFAISASRLYQKNAFDHLLTLALQIAPYRPEPYTILAKMYRLLKNDFSRCYSFAAAGVAQGPPKPDALFVNTHVSDVLWVGFGSIR